MDSSPEMLGLPALSSPTRLAKMPDVELFEDHSGTGRTVRLEALCDIQFHYPEIIAEIIQTLQERKIRDVNKLDHLAIRAILNTIRRERAAQINDVLDLQPDNQSEPNDQGTFMPLSAFGIGPNHSTPEAPQNDDL